MSSPSWCSLPSSPSLLEHHSLLTFVYKCRFGGGVAIVRHDLRSCNAAMAGCQPGKNAEHGSSVSSETTLTPKLSNDRSTRPAGDALLASACYRRVARSLPVYAHASASANAAACSARRADSLLGAAFYKFATAQRRMRRRRGQCVVTAVAALWWRR